MNEKISVIIPVYNVERYLKNCLKSIVGQDYENLEIILVDDGSTDRSGEICERFASEDERIKVIHKENGGISIARNTALDICTGELVAFIDSDDAVFEKYFSTLADALNKNEADIAVCGYKKQADVCFCSGEADVEVFSNSEIPEQVYYKKNIGLIPWGKLIKRDLIGDLRFMVGRINQDDLFSLQVFEKANKVVKVNVPLYNYTVNDTGVTYKRYGPRKIDILPISYEKLKVVERKWPEYLEPALYSAACSFIDIHIEYARRKLHNDAAFKDKLLRDREDLYNYFVSHAEKQTAFINKKVNFYYKNIGKIMLRDRMRFLRYDIKKTIRRIVKGA